MERRRAALGLGGKAYTHSALQTPLTASWVERLTG